MLLKRLNVITVILEPLGAESVDHDCAERSSNDDSKHGRCKHRLSILLVFGEAALLGLCQRHAAKSGLYGGLGNPSESHERSFLVRVLLLKRDQECGNPARRNSNEDDDQALANLAALNLAEEDCGADCSEQKRLAEHPKDGKFVFRFVLLPLSKAHKAVEDNEDELGLWEAGKI